MARTIERYKRKPVFEAAAKTWPCYVSIVTHGIPIGCTVVLGDDDDKLLSAFSCDGEAAALLRGLLDKVYDPQQ